MNPSTLELRISVTSLATLLLAAFFPSLTNLKTHVQARLFNLRSELCQNSSVNGRGMKVAALHTWDDR